MYRGHPPAGDRRVTWQSVTAGFVLNVLVVAILVAVSYPLATGTVIVTGIGLYAARGLFDGVRRRATYERTLQFCRAGLCLRLELSVG